jgi:hypothetical protein
MKQRRLDTERAELMQVVSTLALEEKERLVANELSSEKPAAKSNVAPSFNSSKKGVQRCRVLSGLGENLDRWHERAFIPPDTSEGTVNSFRVSLKVTPNKELLGLLAEATPGTSAIFRGINTNGFSRRERENLFTQSRSTIRNKT